MLKNYTMKYIIIALTTILFFLACEEVNDIKNKIEPLTVLDSIVDVSSYGGDDGKIILDLQGRPAARLL